MRLFPAVDIRGGRVVRLLRGDYERMEVYEATPASALSAFAAAGASCAHVVDLDGAKDGAPAIFDIIAPLLTSSPLFIEVGGGIRDMAAVEKYLSAGAGRVILGTAAVEDRAFLRAAVAAFGERIAVGVDARDGRVAVSGWLRTTGEESFDFCRGLRDEGVSTVIYTDIATDGAMSGTNLPAYERLSELAGLDIVASGGVSTLADIRALRALDVAGCIVGKALYNGALELTAALEAAEGGGI